MLPTGGARPDELAGGGPEPADVPSPGRRWRTLLLVAALVLGVGVVVRDFSATDSGPERQQPLWDAVDDGVNDLKAVRWPARGDLVDDTSFVAAAMSRIRQDRSEVDRVYFAGRLADGSALVLAGSDVLRGVVVTAVHALWVPPGLEPADGQLVEATPLVDRTQVIGWLVRGSGRRAVGVVITRPGPVRFEVSPRVDFREEDGWTSRRWVPLPAENGVAVLDLGSDVDPMVALRADGAGVFSAPFLVHVEPHARARDVTVPGLDDPAYRGPPEVSVERALLQQVGTVADLAASRIQVLWSGAPWKGRKLVLVLVTDPEGRRFQALVGLQGSDEFAAGVRILPDGERDDLPWLLEPFSPEDPTLLLCPSGPGTLMYRRGDRAPHAIPVKADGVAALVVPAPSPPTARGAGITLIDPSGVEVLSTVIPRHGFEDPTALD